MSDFTENLDTPDSDESESSLEHYGELAAPQIHRTPRCDGKTLREIGIRAKAPGLHIKHSFFTAALGRAENQAPKMQESLLLILEGIENQIDELES